jgi:hypothetical protein
MRQGMSSRGLPGKMSNLVANSRVKYECRRVGITMSRLVYTCITMINIKARGRYSI